MSIAKDCAGWDLNQADALRKITKLKGKDPDLVLKTEANFIADCMKVSKMKYEEAKRIWDEQVEPFGLYGFNKSLVSTEIIRVYRDAQGSEFKDVMIKNVEPGVFVKSRDEESGQDILIPVKENHYHGKLKVFEVELDNGKKTRCTINHKFRTTDGAMLPLWKILDDGLEIVCN